MGFLLRQHKKAVCATRNRLADRSRICRRPLPMGLLPNPLQKFKERVYVL